jgi:hypothetical protein
MWLTLCERWRRRDRTLLLLLLLLLLMLLLLLLLLIGRTLMLLLLRGRTLLLLLPRRRTIEMITAVIADAAAAVQFTWMQKITLPRTQACRCPPHHAPHFTLRPCGLDWTPPQPRVIITLLCPTALHLSPEKLENTSEDGFEEEEEEGEWGPGW